MGRRLASEMLLCDKVLTSQEAYNSGFVNAILPKLNFSPDGNFFSFADIPCLSKLLSNDLKTMVNAKKLLNKGRNSKEKQVEVIKNEG
jgi:hypothetical protein